MCEMLATIEDKKLGCKQALARNANLLWVYETQCESIRYY